MYDKLVFNNYYTVDYLDHYFEVHLGEKHYYYGFTVCESKDAQDEDVESYNDNDSSPVIQVFENPKMVMEQLTGGFPNINTDHKLIHDGYGMCASLYYASLAAEASEIYRFKGPNTLYAHIKSIKVNAQGAPLKVELIRGTTANPLTITTAGTEVSGSIQNLNDNSDVVAESKLYNGSVAYTGGEVWCSLVVNGSTTRQSVSGGNFSQSENQEYVTKDGETDYILKITNLDGSDAATHIGIAMFFYEETQGLAS